MSDESAITVTLKGGPGHDVPWIVVRGDNPAQVAAMLRDLGELQQAVVEASNFFHATNNAAPVLANAPQQAAPAPASQQQAPAGWGTNQPTVQQPQQQSVPQGVTLHPEGTTCSSCNSVLQYKVINRRSDGKQFKFWACPNNRRNGDGHDSVFA